jgi:hypothetical protein
LFKLAEAGDRGIIFEDLCLTDSMRSHIGAWVYPDLLVLFPRSTSNLGIYSRCSKGSSFSCTRVCDVRLHCHDEEVREVERPGEVGKTPGRPSRLPAFRNQEREKERDSV